MAQKVAFLASLLSSVLLLSPLAEAVLIIPPIEDLEKTVVHHAGDTLVVDGPCPEGGPCVPDYCIPPVAECNPFTLVWDTVGDILP